MINKTPSTQGNPAQPGVHGRPNASEFTPSAPAKGPAPANPQAHLSQSISTAQWQLLQASVQKNDNGLCANPFKLFGIITYGRLRNAASTLMNKAFAGDSATLSRLTVLKRYGKDGDGRLVRYLCAYLHENDTPTAKALVAKIVSLFVDEAGQRKSPKTEEFLAVFAQPPEEVRRLGVINLAKSPGLQALHTARSIWSPPAQAQAQRPPAAPVIRPPIPIQPDAPIPPYGEPQEGPLGQLHRLAIADPFDEDAFSRQIQAIPPAAWAGCSIETLTRIRSDIPETLPSGRVITDHPMRKIKEYWLNAIAAGDLRPFGTLEEMFRRYHGDHHPHIGLGIELLADLARNGSLLAEQQLKAIAYPPPGAPSHGDDRVGLALAAVWRNNQHRKGPRLPPPGYHERRH